MPFGDEQALTCYVPFTTAELGDGVWSALTGSAAKDAVTLKLRGCKSSGRHDNPENHRSLAVYGIDRLFVQKHFLAVHDAAVAAGIDADRFQLPNRWKIMLDQVLADRGGCLSPLSMPKQKVVLLTLGVRWMTSLTEYESADELVRSKVKNLVNWHVKHRTQDPGEDLVSDALSALGLAGVGLDAAVGTFMRDPQKDTCHLGRSCEVQVPLWQNHKDFFCNLIQRVSSLLRRNESLTTILFYCRSGRHRSVGAAGILKGALGAQGGFDVRVEHLCDYWWKWVRCQSTARQRVRGTGEQACCPSCDLGPTPGQIAIFAEARQMLQDAL